MAIGTTTLHTPGWIGEFRSFITRGNVVDLAVGASSSAPPSPGSCRAW